MANGTKNKGATRITKEQQEALGFSNPREFSRALTDVQNQAQDITRQGRSILRGEGGAQPEFNVADIEAQPGEIASPPQPSNDLARDLAQSAGVAADQALSQQEQDTLDRSDEVQQAQQTQNRLLQRLSGVFGEAQQLGQTEQQLRQEAGIPDKREDVTEISNKIKEKKREFDNQIETIRNDQTLSFAKKEARINQVETEQAQELADLSIIQQTELQEFESAEATVNKKVDLLTQDIQTRLEATKFFFKQNKQELTQEETRQFQRTLKKEQREFERQRSQIKRLEDAKLSAVKQASKNGAPSSVLENIQKADTAEQAFASAEGFLRNPLEVQLLREKILTERFQRSQTALKQAKKQQKQQQENIAAVDQAMNMLRQVKDIKNDPAFGDAVGFISSRAPSIATITGETTDFQSKFDQLKGSLTVENLSLMSGVLSESDIKILENAATRLRTDMTEEAFRKELNVIQDKFQRVVNKKGATNEQLRFYGEFSEDEINSINQQVGDTESAGSTESFTPENFYGAQ